MFLRTGNEVSRHFPATVDRLAETPTRIICSQNDGSIFQNVICGTDDTSCLAGDVPLNRCYPASSSDPGFGSLTASLIAWVIRKAGTVRLAGDGGRGSVCMTRTHLEVLLSRYASTPVPIGLPFMSHSGPGSLSAACDTWQCCSFVTSNGGSVTEHC